MSVVYVVGSLRNPQIPVIANQLRERLPGVEIFDSWYSAGPNADDHLWEYEQQRGHNVAQALANYSAKHIFAFDRFHIDRADTVVVAMPAGKSAMLELGYAIGKGKRGYILMDKDPDRLDVMMQFATGIHYSLDDLVNELKGNV